jgi:hypothetical protein
VVAHGGGGECETVRWRTKTTRRWKRKGSWGPDDEARGGTAWSRPPLSESGFPSSGFWRWWGRGRGVEGGRRGSEATRGRGGGFEWRKRVGRLRREEERGRGVRGALLVV